MYLIRKIKFLCLAVTGLGLIMSCTNDDGGVDPASETIGEIIASNPNLSTLHDAVVRAGLEASFQNPGTLTLLAPTNTAFATFLANTGFASVDDVPEDLLEQILLNHVIGARVDESLLRAVGKNYTESFADGPVANTNLALYFDARGANITFNGTSTITQADLRATNGVVHIVGTVVDRPTLATFVQSNDAFEELTTALTTATPGTNFLATLSGTTNYTLFAPPDAAFEELLDSNPDWDDVEDIEEAELTAVLQHHLVSGILRAADISNGQTAASLEGDLLTFSTANGNLEVTDGAGNSGVLVAVANIQALNGVLHVVDEVLLPDTTN